MSIKKCTR